MEGDAYYCELCISNGVAVILPDVKDEVSYNRLGGASLYNLNVISKIRVCGGFKDQVVIDVPCK